MGLSTAGAVVVDYEAGEDLFRCVSSLLADGIDEIVVVENGSTGSSTAALGELAGSVTLLVPGRNLGFGAGVNRGVAALGPHIDTVIVANPDTITRAGATELLLRRLDEAPAWAIVGPTILTSEGHVYPSVRRFPHPVLAAAHALVGLVRPVNRFTASYRSSPVRPDGGCDWVSGAYFAIRRGIFESLGGFDEGYFMFAEDMDLCWRARQAGYGVGQVPDAVISHVEGVSRAAHPYAMLVAHHRSALRFASQTTSGPARLLLPFAAAVLGVRLLIALGTTARSRRGRTQP